MWFAPKGSPIRVMWAENTHYWEISIIVRLVLLFGYIGLLFVFGKTIESKPVTLETRFFPLGMVAPSMYVSETIFNERRNQSSYLLF